jgi:(S)-2-hydroxyglutarate dehydrogenase
VVNGAGNGRCDLAVVGGGILGLALARELSGRRPGLRITVFEREPDVGRHQTGHNSGVLHAGIYYKPGSLKAQLCVEGVRLMYEFCERHGIAHERCGKVIVATRASELAGLDELEARGRANGVPGLRRIGPEELRELEPHATSAIAALHSPNTGIVDFGAVARALAAELRSGGADVRTGCEVTAVETGSGGGRVVVRHAGGETVAAHAVVCAGAWSDRLAVAAGAPEDPRIVPFRGAYLRLRPEARSLVRGLIYPVPDPRLPFLGVHLTRHIDGEVLLGPTALLVGARDAYRLWQVRARDAWATLSWPGTWRMMGRFRATAVSELRMAVSRRAFVAACARYVPELRAEDVIAGGPSGIRAQALARDGTLVDDFVINELGPTAFVRNAPSPAATSSLAIAARLADRLQAGLER